MPSDKFFLEGSALICRPTGARPRKAKPAEVWPYIPVSGTLLKNEPAESECRVESTTSILLAGTTTKGWEAAQEQALAAGEGGRNKAGMSHGTNGIAPSRVHQGFRAQAPQGSASRKREPPIGPQHH